MIKNEGRETLLLLYKYLKKTKKGAFEENKSNLFKAIFKQPYSKSKDYLLRNELRLLNKVLEAYLMEKSIPSKERRYFYIRALLERERFHLFEIEVKKELKKAVEQNDPEYVSKLLQLRLMHRIKTDIYNPESLGDNIELCQQIWRIKERSNDYFHADLAVKVNFFNQVRQVLGGREARTLLEPRPYKTTDAYLEFLIARAGGFQMDKVQKKKELLRALELLETAHFYDLNKDKERFTLLSNLSLEYLLSRDYERAAKSFGTILGTLDDASPVRVGVTFNYLTCLLKSKAYKKAIEIVESGLLTLRNVGMMRGKLSSIMAMAYIFDGQLDKAYETIPLNMKEGARFDYFYTRQVLTIIYVEDSMREVALREIDNLLQIISKENVEANMHRQCALYLKAYISTFDRPGKLDALYKKVTHFIKNGGENSDMLPLLWLQERLMSSLKSSR